MQGTTLIRRPTGAIGRGGHGRHRVCQATAAPFRLPGNDRAAAGTRAGCSASPAPASPDRCWRAPAPVCSGARFWKVKHGLKLVSCSADPGQGPLSGSACSVLQAGASSVATAPLASASSGRDKAPAVHHPAPTPPTASGGELHQVVAVLPGKVRNLSYTVLCSPFRKPLNRRERSFQLVEQLAVNWAWLVEQVGVVFAALAPAPAGDRREQRPRNG